MRNRRGAARVVEELLTTKDPEPLPRPLTHQLIDVDAWLVELARDAGLDERDIEIAERGCLLDESPADIAGDLGFAEKAVRNGITEIEKTLHTELQT